jgi:EmrB/QacA subfamily drug resistance transporter
MATLAPGAQAQAAAPFSVRSILAPLVALILGLFMVILDNTVVNVALPTLVTDFHSNLHTLQWVLTGYMLAQAAVIPLAGWLSDRFGAKRVFLIAVALFTIGSALCATAQSAEMLIAFRVLQGFGGGCVMPIAMAYTYRLSPPDKRGQVMGTMGIPILFAPAIGPTLSGWLVQYADWRWIFLINIPVGIVAVLIGLRRLPVMSRQVVAALDLPGIILGPLAFAALSYGINEGATSWTSANTLGGLIIGGVALLTFIVVELRTDQPLLELRVFKSRDFDLAIICQWTGQAALFGSIFLLPLFLQQVRGYGPFVTGLTLLPQAIAAGIFMPIGGRLFDRIGARPLVVIGLGLVAVSSVILTHLSVTTTSTELILPLAMRGAGMGLMMMSLNTHLLNAAPRKLISRVTSLTNALQQVVSSLAIAALATILTSRVSFHLQAATAALPASHRPKGAPVPPQVAAELHHLSAVAYANAFNDCFMVVAVLAAVGALLGLTLRRNYAAQAAQAPASGQSAEQAGGMEMVAG